VVFVGEWGDVVQITTATFVAPEDSSFNLNGPAMSATELVPSAMPGALPGRRRDVEPVTQR
jgi:hypothetical protein